MAAAKSRRNAKAIMGALAVARQINKFPSATLWLDFDEEADVLYITSKRPPGANRTVEMDDGEILLDYHDKELVGITVLNVSKL